MSFIRLFSGLLLGWALAQKSSPVPAEKLVHYEAVLLLRDYKPGTDPSPHWERIQRLILSKVGFYDAQLVATEGQQLKVRLSTDPEMPLSDIYEVLRAAGTETRSLYRIESSKTTQTK
ncbi:MAG: hypothetical protein RMJ57_02440 [Bacteroidia bacterium]|nr:hypothetical protein [Bacteroidia bacterium]